MKTKFFECVCHCDEHIMRVSYDEDGVYIGMHLKTLPLHKRIVVAIMYLFGYKSKYGCFDEIIVKDVKKLKRLLTAYQYSRQK